MTAEDIRLASDHALLLRAITLGVAQWDRWDHERGEICAAGLRCAAHLDKHGCPALYPHARSVIIAAIARQSALTSPN